MTNRYRSPYRPLDMGWAIKAAKEAGAPVEADWSATDIGAWTKETVYAFTGPLPERFVNQWSLEEVK